MIVVGLTGSIGMGKSTAGEMLVEMGIPLHDADEAVHRLMGPGGAAVDAVGAEFPGAVAEKDGETYIDRQALGKEVIGNPEKLKKLEAILHPLVKRDADEFVEAMRKKGETIVVLDIPLLFEVGRDADMDVTVCISAPKDIQRQRVLARPNMTEEKFEKIVASQLPDAEKRKRADFVISSAEGLEPMRAALEDLAAKLKNMDRRRAPKNGNGLKK